MSAAATNNNTLMRRDAKERRCRSPSTLTVRKEAGATADVPKVVRSRSSSSASSASSASFASPSSSAITAATKSVSKTLSRLATPGKNVASAVNPKLAGSLRLGGDPGKVAVGKKTTSTTTVAVKKPSEGRGTLVRSTSTGLKVAANANGKGLVKSSTVSAAKIGVGSSKVVPEKKKTQIVPAKGKVGGGGGVVGKSLVKKGAISPRSEYSLASANGRRKGEASSGATKSTKPVAVAPPVEKEKEKEEDDMVIMDVGDSEESLLSEETDDQILESLPDPDGPTKLVVDSNLETRKSPESNEEKVVIVAEINTETFDEVNRQIPDREMEEAASAPPDELVKATATATKKETATKQAYNDVIEETAGKLVGKGKSKVLALAGAFQTVISLQEPGTGTTHQPPPALQRRNAAEEKPPTFTKPADDVAAAKPEGTFDDVLH